MKAGLFLTIAIILRFAILSIAAPIYDHKDFDTDVTITVFIPGYFIGGEYQTGVFGEDSWDGCLNMIAEFTGLPTMMDDPSAPNQIAATRFYGDTPPSYYTEEDLQDLQDVIDIFGGGVPKYALISAKYILHVLERSGAESANVIGGSFGALIARYMIENNVCGLAGNDLIDRWLIFVASLPGNFWANWDLLIILYEELFGESYDVKHLNYDWVAENIWPDPWSSGSPYLGRIIKHQFAGTNDDLSFGFLTLVSGGLGNDGTTLIRDAQYRDLEKCSRFMGTYMPTMSHYFANHSEMSGNEAVSASCTWALLSPRRVRITITEAYIPEISERPLRYPGEIVFQTVVHSPLALELWGIEDPINTWTIRDNNLAVYEWESHQRRSLNEIAFYGPVSPDETTLEISLDVCEVDWWPDRLIFENVLKEYDVLASAGGALPVKDGSYRLHRSGCEIAFEVTVEDLY